jgi:monofunctional biosynthetic peptidoglycan transglycosylase
VAIKAAIQTAKNTKRPVGGASTITQQCARSLFLWQKRSWIRKGLEAYYTVWMELLLSKQRIFELYINVIELGEGIYGIEAASRYYFGIPAKEMTLPQSAALAIIVPSPLRRNPLAMDDWLRKYRNRLMLRVQSLRFPVPMKTRN